MVQVAVILLDVLGTLVATTAKKPEIKAAYDAPFPDKHFKAGPLMMPQIVPMTPHDPATEANKKAWQVLRQWHKPFLTAFGDSDPITRGSHRPLQERILGAQGQPHTTIVGGGHFLQEDCGDELARVVAAFVAS